jgi:hypothetical protein
MFAKTIAASHKGKSVYDGCKLLKSVHPGLLIISMDGLEACSFLACRASAANFPCPKCLVPHGQQHRLDLKFPLRTKEMMMAQWQKAQDAPNKTAKEKILQAFGMHDTKV